MAGRRIIIGVIGCTAILGGCWYGVVGLNSRNLASPRVQFYATQFDFGSIGPNERVNWQFRFRNAGAQAVRVLQIITSCGCTTPDIPAVPCKPGESQSINVEFSSNGLSGSTVVNKKLVVRFDSHDIEEVTLQVIGVVQPYINVSPAQLVFEDITGAVCKGLISRGSLKEGLFQQLTIESPMGKYLSELTDIDSEHKEFKITLVDPGAGRALVPFTVTAPSLKSSQGRTILATVQCSREGPRIAPPAFIYSSRLHGDDVSLKRNERRRFKIKSADELQLTEVIVSDVADSLLIGIVDTDRKSFTLEFTNLPVRSLNTTVAVKYVNQSGNRIGSINLPIRIYVAAEGDKSQ